MICQLCIEISDGKYFQQQKISDMKNFGRLILTCISWNLSDSLHRASMFCVMLNSKLKMNCIASSEQFHFIFSGCKGEKQKTVQPHLSLCPKGTCCWFQLQLVARFQQIPKGTIAKSSLRTTLIVIGPGVVTSKCKTTGPCRS